MPLTNQRKTFTKRRQRVRDGIVLFILSCALQMSYYLHRTSHAIYALIAYLRWGK